MGENEKHDIKTPRRSVQNGPGSFPVLETPDAEPVRAVIVIHGVHLRGRHVQIVAVGGIRGRSPVVPVHALIVVRGRAVVAVTGEAVDSGRLWRDESQTRETPSVRTPENRGGPPTIKFDIIMIF